MSMYTPMSIVVLDSIAKLQTQGYSKAKLQTQGSMKGLIPRNIGQPFARRSLIV